MVPCRYRTCLGCWDGQEGTGTGMAPCRYRNELEWDGQRQKWFLADTGLELTGMGRKGQEQERTGTGKSPCLQGVGEGGYQSFCILVNPWEINCIEGFSSLVTLDGTFFFWGGGRGFVYDVVGGYFG